MSDALARPQLLTDDESRDLSLLAIYTATAVDKRHGLPDAELDAILGWARNVRIEQALLENAIAGAMFIRWNTETNEPSFSMTPKGAAEAKALVERQLSKSAVNPPPQSREDPAGSPIAPKTGESEKVDS